MALRLLPDVLRSAVRKEDIPDFGTAIAKRLLIMTPEERRQREAKLAERNAAANAARNAKTVQAWLDGKYDGNAAKMVQTWLDGKYDGNAAKMVQAWLDGKYDGNHGGNAAKMVQAWVDVRYDGNAPKTFQAWLDGKFDTKAACAGRSKQGGQSHADVEAACEREYLNMCHERQTQCTLDPEIHKAVEKLRSEGDLTPARADFLDKSGPRLIFLDRSGWWY
jgi:hypothetical protein